MAIKRVTEQRYYAKTDHYRLIMNVDKDLVAFGYNAFVGCFTNGPHAYRIRNEMAKVVADVVQRRLAELYVEDDSPYRRYVKATYYPDMIEGDRLHGRARRFYKRLTVIGKGLRP